MSIDQKKEKETQNVNDDLLEQELKSHLPNKNDRVTVPRWLFLSQDRDAVQDSA